MWNMKRMVTAFAFSYARNINGCTLETRHLLFGFEGIVKWSLTVAVFPAWGGPFCPIGHITASTPLMCGNSTIMFTEAQVR